MRFIRQIFKEKFEKRRSIKDLDRIYSVLILKNDIERSKFDTYRRYIENENSLVSSRLGSFLSFQSFLFASFSITFATVARFLQDVILHVLLILNSPLNKPISANNMFATEIVCGALLLFLVFICVIGKETSSFAIRTIAAAENSILLLYKTYFDQREIHVRASIFSEETGDMNLDILRRAKIQYIRESGEEISITELMKMGDNVVIINDIIGAGSLINTSNGLEINHKFPRLLKIFWKSMLVVCCFAFFSVLCVSVALLWFVSMPLIGT